MNHLKEPESIQGKGYFPACKILPKESDNIAVYTPDRGLFTATRNGHDWRVGNTKKDGDAWISFAIKDNDWWRYMDVTNGQTSFKNRDTIK